MAEVVLPATVHVSPSGDEVMTLSTRTQPLPGGAAFQVRLACALPAVALTLVGAPGSALQRGPIVFGEFWSEVVLAGAASGAAMVIELGVTLPEGDEASPVPAMLVAVTANV